MKVAHLILTYTNPFQTERMIEAMRHPDFDFYIHVDKKIDIKSHLYLANLPNVYLIKNRVTVIWAGYNTVKATFSAIKEIEATKIKYDYINFLSGQDFPIKTGPYIHQFLERNAGKQFIESIDIQNNFPEDMKRVYQTHLINLDFKGMYKIEYIINAIRKPRKIPDNLTIYGKAMFWMLTQEAANYVVKKVEGKKEYNSFFQYTWGCDELVFQTILNNSNFSNDVVNNHYRYVDWSMGGSHPKVFDKSDFNQIITSDNLFARKFSLSHDKEIIELIETHLKQQLG